MLDISLTQPGQTQHSQSTTFSSQAFATFLLLVRCLEFSSCLVGLFSSVGREGRMGKEEERIAQFNRNELWLRLSRLTEPSLRRDK